MDKREERLARMEELLHQLIGLVGKTNSSVVDLESRLNRMEESDQRLHQRMEGLEHRLNQRIDGLEQRLDRMIDGHHRDVTILKSESDHLARKVGVLERDLAVVRSQS